MDYRSRRTHDKTTEKSRKWIWYLGGCLLLVLILAPIIAFLWYQGNLKPVQEGDEAQTFVIPKGSSTRIIAERLEEEGLVRNAWAFLLLTKQQGWGGKFQAGSYTLSGNMTAEEIGEALLTNVEGVWVTFQEGIRREEMLKILDDKFDVEGGSFNPGEFMELTEELEGELFPETYLFPTLSSTSLVVNEMHRMHEEQVQELVKEGQAIGYDNEELVVLASLLEREAAKDEDLPMVAGILFNRLELGMPLQVDATFQYAKANLICESYDCDDWWPDPVATDKEIDSPYNTYLYPGLPPGPIANPGLRALRAAYTPEENNYLYYLTDGNGQMYYAETYDEHLGNIERYLR